MGNKNNGPCILYIYIICICDIPGVNGQPKKRASKVSADMRRLPVLVCGRLDSRVLGDVSICIKIPKN